MPFPLEPPPELTATVSLPLPLVLRARVRAWVDHWLPDGVVDRGPEARRRARLTVVVSLLAAPVGAILALVYLLLGSPALAATLCSGTALVLVTPIVLRRLGNVDLAGLWATVHVGWPLAVLAASGRAGAAATSGFAVVALLAALLAPRSAAWVVGALVVVACVITGWLAAPTEPLLSLVAVTATLSVFGIGMVFRATSDDALHRFHAAIAQLRNEIDKHRRTRGTLEEVHRELLEQAAIAGRAEIANGILHNVGNTLSWVGMAAEEMSERLGESRIPRLRRAATLLESHKEHLPAFFATDPKAGQVVDYLAAASLAVGAEREELVRDLGRLREGLEHIKATVKMQQAYARPTLLEEVVAVDRIIDEAIRYSDAAVRVENVRIVREVGDLPLVMLDKHRVMQILVNLLANAKRAVRDNATDGPRVVVRCEVTSTSRLKFTVVDNGIGIAPDDLPRLFQHGYTTRRDGHGFGLHSSLVAARQMNGSLACASDGPTKGARFELELPLQPVRRLPGQADQPTEVVARPSWVEEDSDPTPALS